MLAMTSSVGQMGMLSMIIMNRHGPDGNVNGQPLLARLAYIHPLPRGRILLQAVGVQVLEYIPRREIWLRSEVGLAGS